MEHRTNETPLLQTIGLQKYFKVRGNSLLHAVDGIDLTLYSGQTLGVVLSLIHISEPTRL